MKIDIGNTAFMLICASLVMLMTPGLAFFYGGLVGRKSVLTVMIQSFISLSWTTVLWFVFGYSMCFGPTWHGIIGDPTYYAFLRGVNLQSMFSGNDAGIPLVVHIAPDHPHFAHPLPTHYPQCGGVIHRNGALIPSPCGERCSTVGASSGQKDAYVLCFRERAR